MADQFQLKALIVGVDKLSPLLRTIKGNVNGFKRELNSFGKDGIALAAGLGAGIGLASKAFADFEDAGLRLKSSLMGMSGAIAPEFEKINALALELGNKLPGNTADFQNMMTALVQQGITGQEILSGIGKAAAYLGVQLKLAPEQAAEFAAKMKTATSTTGADMMGLMDVIQRTANLGVRSDDMLAGFAKMTPALDMIKIKGLEAGKALAPLLAISIRSGMAGEAAGNAYRKMFQAFFDPTKMGAANGMLAKRGAKLDFTNGKGEFGGLEKMFAQLQKLRGLTTGERVPILKKLFGDDAETQQVVNDMIKNGIEGYDAMRQKMEAQASLQMRVESQLSSLKNLFDAAMGNAQNLLATVGEAFSPEIKSLVDSLGTFAAWAQDFVKANPNVIRSLVAIATAFVGIKLVALALAGTLGLVTALMSMSGIGLALRGLALAAGLIIANWEPISAFFKGLWDGIGGFFSRGVDKVKALIADVSAFMEPFLSKLNWMEDKIGAIFRSSAPAMGSSSVARGSLAPAIAAQNNRLNGAIDVRFANAPQGMRVTGVQSMQSGVALNPDVGYNSFAMGTP